MLAARIPRKKPNTTHFLKPVLPIIPEQLPNMEENKSKYISIELKARVGASTSSSSTYKKYVKLFEEGTPQEWIDTLQDIREIWTQNSITGPTDKVSTVRAILKGESLIAFESSLQEARLSEEGLEAILTAEHIELALQGVTATVFPHRALELQRLWMQRAMKKPYDLSIRKTVASITKINNSLPLFPGATEDSKFSEKDLIMLIEWSLPPAWRAKFDLEGYIPTDHNKKRLVEACEAIERSQVGNAAEKTNFHKKNGGFSKPEPKGKQKGHSNVTKQQFFAPFMVKIRTIIQLTVFL